MIRTHIELTDLQIREALRDHLYRGFGCEDVCVEKIILSLEPRRHGEKGFKLRLTYEETRDA
jgi:hypothetical protein